MQTKNLIFQIKDFTQSDLNFEPSFAAIHEEISLFEHKFQAGNVEEI